MTTVRASGWARRSRAATLAALLALGLAACSSDQPSDQQAAPTTPTPTPTPSATLTPAKPSQAGASAEAFGAARPRLRQVATLDAPLGMAAPAGDSTIYIAEQSGKILAIRSGKLDRTPVIDLGADIIAGGEQGLLGLAISPDRKYLYVNLTNTDANTSIREYPLRGGRADASSMRELLQIKDFAANHNGGQLAFGPDGYLYIATGDGGGGGDPKRNGQSLSTLLGKILRISPRPGGGQPYVVPDDNPFVNRGGARPEIWAFGLRNPWRFSFDPATGDLWIGDVGQNQWEEVDVQPGTSSGGQNYGWNLREGDHAYEGPKPQGAVDPVIEYGHSDGCTVIGGAVYRGTAIAGLRGAYLYGDYCAGWVRAVRTERGRPAGKPRDLGLNVPGLSSFGTDQQGELWLLSLNGGVYRLTR